MIFWLWILSSFSSLNAQIIHSVDRMENAIEHQRNLADHLAIYLGNEYRRLHQIERFIYELRMSSKVNNLTREELEVEMSHPVRVLRMVSDLYTETENIRKALQPTVISEVLNFTLNLLPSKLDYVGANQALIRLQETYQGQADFTNRSGKDTDDVLTAQEVFDLGISAMDASNYYTAYDNMERAKEMWLESNDTTRAMMAYDYMAYLKHQQGNVDYALNYTYELLAYYRDSPLEDVKQRLESNAQMYVNELGGEEAAKIKVKLPNPPIPNPAVGYRNYNELCRGETVKIEGLDMSKTMTCRLVSRNNPLLILAPAKLEEIRHEASLSFYHDVINDREIDLLRRLAATKFEDSGLVRETNNSDFFVDSLVRSSNTGWVADSEDERVLAISRRVSAILGLDISSAEQFQVLSYGIGGFYLPHFDYNSNSPHDPFPGLGGDRIATWIFYLNNISKGGATVFPELGATIWPEKGGAAFWWNLHENGAGNKKTLHAACPVLEGYKWVSNKWFHEHGNEFHRPCSIYGKQ